MEFSLLYQGALKSNGTCTQKQQIRRAFHPQLKALWQQPPLNSFHEFVIEDPSRGNVSILRKVGDSIFAPLVSEGLKLSPELDIIFLRSEAPGSLITQGGDIGDRLKILFDELGMARKDEEIPRNENPKQDENPFPCVLEDDSLITRVSVKTDRLLMPMPSNNYVHLLITVKTKIVLRDMV